MKHQYPLWIHGGAGVITHSVYSHSDLPTTSSHEIPVEKKPTTGLCKFGLRESNSFSPVAQKLVMISKDSFT